MNIKHLLHYSIAGIMLLASATSMAAEGINKLNNFMLSIVTYQADFKQTILDLKGNVIEEAQGKLQLERPGKFRWDYNQPYPQHIIADGERIWFYDVDLEQITVNPQQETLADSPAALLSGVTMPDETYNISEFESDDGLFWVRLVPKDLEANFQKITLAFNKHGLSQMVLRDSFGQQTRLVFTHAKENLVLADNTFTFIPPKGVDVVGDTGLPVQ